MQHLFFTFWADSRIEEHIIAREYSWTESSDLEECNGLFGDESSDSLYLSNEDDEVPFTRHGPIIEAPPSKLSVQRYY